MTRRGRATEVPCDATEARRELDARGVAALRASVRGAVLTRGDAGYDDARRVLNAAIAARPQAVVQVANAADIAATLGFARRLGLTVSVRGGGHGVDGRAVAGNLVIDVRALRGIRVDAARRTVTVGGGALWAAVDAATCSHGLALPGSRVGGTGATGLALGGGLGWLSGRYGLTEDHIVAAELVMADGRRVMATPDHTPDLFSSLRGGGAFGAVTALTFRVHPAPQQVLAGMLLYPLAALPDVLGTLAQLRGQEPASFAPLALLIAAPPQAFVPGDVVGYPVVAVVPAWLGDPALGRSFLSPLLERFVPLAGSVTPTSYLVLQSVLDELAVPGLGQRFASCLLPAVDSGVSTSLEDAAAELAGTRRYVLMTPIPDETAILSAGARHPSAWLVQCVGRWQDAAGAGPARKWLTDTVAALCPHGTRGALGEWPGFQSAATRAGIDPAHVARLQAVKAAWDPDNVFASTNRIAPASPND